MGQERRSLKSMRRIFIDLEMNPVSNTFPDIKRILRSEIIQIGAVVMEEDLSISGEFSKFVRPGYNDKIKKKITSLTGITTEMVREAGCLSDVLPEFLSWCGKEDYEICSWSESDIWQLMQELSAKKIPDYPGLSYMLNHWRDIQEDFRAAMQMDHMPSLKNAVYLADLDFEGMAHDALADARNTALLYKASRDSEGYRRLKAASQDAMTPHTFTMGDMFDMSGIKLD